jgi:ubiquinone/menaquinone biosynthesis C-methylase UbiE
MLEKIQDEKRNGTKTFPWPADVEGQTGHPAGQLNEWSSTRPIQRQEDNWLVIDEEATNRTQARFERIAPFYDRMERFIEPLYKAWRPRLWSLVRGPKVLEVGVGTGKNIPYYPAGMDITAIDLVPGMLERAQMVAADLDASVHLQLGDVQRMDFSDNTFDDVAATFVFCTVPNPTLGLREVARVLKPEGQLLLLEHVRAANPFGLLMDLFNPVAVRLMGSNINRRTLKNIRQSGLVLERVEHAGMGGIFKFIVARKR